MKKKQAAESLKNFRQLYLYNKLMNGETVNIRREAEFLGVAERTVHRDIEDLRAFLANRSDESRVRREIISDRKTNGYYMSVCDKDVLSRSEALAVCKILLESRAFCTDEIASVIDRIMKNCVSGQDHKAVDTLISNELYHYIEPHRKQHFTGSLWDIETAVSEQKYMDIVYERPEGTDTIRRIMPAEIIFSGHYFYLAAYTSASGIVNGSSGKDDIFPAIYRIDRIRSCEITDEHFFVPYKNRFEKDEFRKRIQFIYGGTLRRVKFLYKGSDPETVLDRFPTAVIQDNTEEGFIISAEVFGRGIEMWIRSQGDLIQMM